MLIFRWLLMLLMVAGLVCLGLAIVTGQPRWRQMGMVIIKWAVVATLGFFAVLLLERMAIIL